MSSELFNNFKKIKIDTPVDQIVDQINELISSGQLKAEDKMPSERFLSEQFNVGRMSVRDALTKLEFYGVLKKVPQGGQGLSHKNLISFKALINSSKSS